jgi:hypothetical protein
MTRAEWYNVLASIYQAARMLPHWDRILELHDDADRNYFAMLDNLTGRK